MRVLGLKYVGKREEGIMVMLFKSYKTVRITKAKPYKFTERDRVDEEACNYYKKLTSKLGIALITDEKDFSIKLGHSAEVRNEPMAAETDVQIDPTASAATPDDQVDINQEISGDQELDSSSSSNTTNEASSEVEGEGKVSTPVTSSDSVVDREAIKLMSAAEISEYLEMNFSRDQIKSMIEELSLDISIGRKSTPNLIGELVAATELDKLVDYLCK